MRLAPAVFVILGVGLVASAQSVMTADDLLHRAGEYVEKYERDFANVVTEEEYAQRYKSIAAGKQSTWQRTLVSDFLLARVTGEDSLLPFRDVRLVDGKAVRDRQERLTRLFMQSPSTAIAAANAVVAEGARYNLGPKRTINIPTVGLIVMRPTNQQRFQFSKPKADGSGGPSVWAVEFKERQRPTLIRSSAGDNVVARGRVWIDATTGAVVRTDLQLDGKTVTTVLATRYAFNEALGMFAPVTMFERNDYTNGESLWGDAKYGNYRRFTVDVTEQIKK